MEFANGKKLFTVLKLSNDTITQTASDGSSDDNTVTLQN